MKINKGVEPKLTIVSAIVMLLTLTFAGQSLAQPPIESLSDLQTEYKTKIDALAQPYLDQELAVGFTIGIIKSGETAVFGYGQLSEDDTRVPDGTTIFEIGSISKVFTGMLLADAVVQERVTLDQPVQEILGDAATLNVVDDKPILLRHLSTHTSGLPRLPFGFSPTNADDPYADYSAETLYQSLKKGKSLRAPGAQHAYSNFAVGMLGHLLAVENDTSYSDLLQERIAGPLGLVDTTIELNEDQLTRFAQGHSPGGGEVEPWNLNVLSGAGGIRSTTDDMLNFIADNLNPPDDDAGKMIKLAWQKHQEPIDGSFEMGLGWMIAKDGTTRWHNGQTAGYHSIVFASQLHDTGVVLLVNTAEGELTALAESIMRLLAGKEEAPRQFKKVEVVELTDPNIPTRCEGEYEFAPGVVLTVENRKGNLFAKLTGQTWARIYPRSDSEWFYKIVKASLVFDLEGDGPAASVRLLQNGGDQKAMRK